MLKVNIMLYMNHVIQDIDTPPRLLPVGGLVSLSYHPTIPKLEGGEMGGGEIGGRQNWRVAKW